MIESLLWIIFIFLPAPALAQVSIADGVILSAENMDRDLSKGIVNLQGHVQLVFQGQHLSCDRAQLNQKKEKIIAEGNVIISNATTHAEGDRLEFNYKTNKGFIYNGFVQSGQVVFEGTVIEKVDKEHYIANNATYTACMTCPPGWSLSGKVIDAEFGGYARIKRPIFYVGGVPVLILPGLIVPLKSSRQSGFLVPSMDFYGKGGVAFSESYFLVINRSQDVTFTEKWYEFRGFKTSENYRYVLGTNSSGSLSGGWIRDHQVKDEPEFHTAGNVDRWHVVYGHHFDLPDRFVQGMNLNLVSDLRYPRDFIDDTSGNGSAALENRFSLAKSTDDQYASVDASLYTNMLKDQPLATNDDAVHRFPEIRYSIKETELFPNGPLFHFDLDYVNFARDRYNYDNLVVDNSPNHGFLSGTLGGDGRVVRTGYYNPKTDIIRTGERLDLQPGLAYPFHIGKAFDVMPAAIFRDTQYRFFPTAEALNPTDPSDSPFKSTANRLYLQDEIYLKSDFSHIYGDLTDPNATRWKHDIEPEVGYVEIPWVQRPKHPFFGVYDKDNAPQYSRQFDPITDADVMNPNEKLQFDYQDRTYDKQIVNLALSNRLTRKLVLDGTPEYMRAVLFRVGQSYNFKDKHYPLSSVDGLLDARFTHFVTNTSVSYNTYAHVTNLSSQVRVITIPTNFVQLSYSHNFTVDDQQTITGENRNIGLGFGFTTKYVEALAQVDMIAETYEVQAYNYLMVVHPPGRCWALKFQRQLVVGSDDPKISASMAFEFGGEAPQKKYDENGREVKPDLKTQKVDSSS